MPHLNLSGVEWAMFSRTSNYSPNLALPISSAKIVRKHMGVSRATITTPYRPEVYESLLAGNGVSIYRAGRQEFSGPVSELDFDWAPSSGELLIRAGCLGDEQHLADRIAFPDPLRADADQTVNTHWRTRDGAGAPLAVAASTGMLQLISDQGGATALADRRIPGVSLGTDPVVGEVRAWSALFENVMSVLQGISVVSGANLGIRAQTAPGSLTYSIVTPRDRAGDIRFSADLLNLAGVSYRIVAPTTTDAVAAGKGELNTRLRRASKSTDPETLAWKRRIWQYIDRRDTDDLTELTTAAADAIIEGQETVSLAVTLRDSEATTYGVDWDLGDRVTVYVGLAGETKIATVVDIVREVLLEVDGGGVESVRPAIGSFDASTASPIVAQQQQQLRDVRQGLAGLIVRN